MTVTTLDRNACRALCNSCFEKKDGGGGGGLKSYAAWQERKVVWVAVNLGNMAVISQ